MPKGTGDFWFGLFIGVIHILVGSVVNAERHWRPFVFTINTTHIVPVGSVVNAERHWRLVQTCTTEKLAFGSEVW